MLPGRQDSLESVRRRSIALPDDDTTITNSTKTNTKQNPVTLSTPLSLSLSHSLTNSLKLNLYDSLSIDAAAEKKTQLYWCAPAVS